MGHHCKPHIQLFIDNDDSDDPYPSPDSESPDVLPTPTPLPRDPPHLSLNALLGMLTLETVCVYGYINHHRVTILVDDGSTHNFVQTRIAKFLELASSPITPF